MPGFDHEENRERLLRRMLPVGGLGGLSENVSPRRERGQLTKIHRTRSDLAGHSGKLLVMTATGDSIASGGDYTDFDTIVDQHGFSNTPLAGQSWSHPVTGIYVLTYEHAWDSYEGGGTIEIEIDGVVPDDGTIGSAISGQNGRGTILYYADANSEGKIKVTQSSGSAQTCDATVRIGITDPTADVASPTVELFINEVRVGSSHDSLETVDYTSTTVIIGEQSGTVSAVSDIYWDVVSLVSTGSELLSNQGFESALAGTGTDRSVTTGNWRAYQLGTASVAVSTLQAKSGSQSGRVDINGTGANQGGYFFQDVTMTEGAGFEFSWWVYPTDGTQVASLLFDWNRSDTADHSCNVTVAPGSTSVTAFGVMVSADALPQNEWSRVRVKVAAQAVA